MESQNHLAAINDTLIVLIQRFDAMEARQDSSDARFEKLYRNFMDKCDMGLHHPFNKMTSPISLVKSNQVVLKLQTFHEEKIRALEKVEEFWSQFRPRYKPKSPPCLRPTLKKFKRVRGYAKYHEDGSARFRSNSKFQVSFGDFRKTLVRENENDFDLFDKVAKDSMEIPPFLDSDCKIGTAKNLVSGFLISELLEKRDGLPSAQPILEIMIGFQLIVSVGTISGLQSLKNLDKEALKQIGFVGLDHCFTHEFTGSHALQVFDERPHSADCEFQLGYHMPISDSGGTLITGHFTSNFQVKDAYNSTFLVCNGEFLKNGTTDLRDEIVLVVPNKTSDESEIMPVGFVGFYPFMNAQPSILENECQQELVGMYARHVVVGMQQTISIVSLNLGFHVSIRDKGGTKFISSFESMDLLASCEDLGFCVVLYCDYYKGIRDKGGDSNFSTNDNEQRTLDVAFIGAKYMLKLEKRCNVELMCSAVSSPEKTLSVVSYFRGAMLLRLKYELADDCADDDDAKPVISELRNAVRQELKMHDSFVKEWGLQGAKEAPINSAAVKYTDFLLATASGKVGGVKGTGKLTPFETTQVAAYILGTMTPCMRLYPFLGKEFKALLDSKEGSHPYLKWIDNYAYENFQASAVQIEELLDKLSVSSTGGGLDIIEKLYHLAMKLEIEFFSAQFLVQRTIVHLINKHIPAEDRLVIFSDFDLTCTIVDSSAILVEIAIVTAPKSDQKSDQHQAEDQIVRMSSADLRNTWGLLSRQYTEEYEQCIGSIVPTAKTVFDYENLHKAREKLSNFERNENNRVTKSGVLKGLNLKDITRAGERLILQDGCIKFFQKIVRSGNLNANVHALSYCWCGDLIRSAFSSGGLPSWMCMQLSLL